MRNKNNDRKDEGPSTRQLRVGQLIKQVMSELFLKERFLNENVPVTIMEVRMSADLRYATVFVLPRGEFIDKKKFIDELESISYKLRSKIGKILKLKFSPEIRFKFDDSAEYADKINSLLDKIL